MAKLIKLTEEIMAGDKKVKEIELDFSSLRGIDLLDAEKEVRTFGDDTPMLMFSMRYQAALVARLTPLTYDDVLSLNGKDFTALTNEVASFLMRRG